MEKAHPYQRRGLLDAYKGENNIWYAFHNSNNTQVDPDMHISPIWTSATHISACRKTSVQIVKTLQNIGRCLVLLEICHYGLQGPGFLTTPYFACPESDLVCTNKKSAMSYALRECIFGLIIIRFFSCPCIHFHSHKIYQLHFVITACIDKTSASQETYI